LYKVKNRENNWIGYLEKMVQYGNEKKIASKKTLNVLGVEVVKLVK